MRLPNSEFHRIALELSPYLSAHVQQARTLTPEAVRTAVLQARREGRDVPNVSSVRSLQLVNEAYCAL